LLEASLAKGELTHQIGARMPLAQIADAHRAVETGAVIGNVVLRI
jgi:NADPH:quinone reductase-like Zn-dependent oxidoreductase